MGPLKKKKRDMVVSQQDCVGSLPALLARGRLHLWLRLTRPGFMGDRGRSLSRPHHQLRERMNTLVKTNRKLS